MSKNESLDLSVVVPVFDEPLTIESVIEDLFNVLSMLGLSYEIILIDDGSPDRIHFERARFPDLKMVRNLQRQGSGAARKKGHALAIGQWILWIDGDATYETRDIPALWAARENQDQIVGCRRTDHGKLGRIRTLVKSIACTLASRIWDRPIPDLNSGLRLMRRESASKWIDCLPNGFSCTTTATLASLKKGQRLAFVPVQHYPRSPGSQSKFHPLRDTWLFLRTTLRWRPSRTDI